MNGTCNFLHWEIEKKDTTFIVGKLLVDKFCSLTSLKFITFGQRMESQQRAQVYAAHGTML